MTKRCILAAGIRIFLNDLLFRGVCWLEDLENLVLMTAGREKNT